MVRLQLIVYLKIFFFFFKQTTADEMRISDWSSDVCSSDLRSRSTITSPTSQSRPCCQSSDRGCRRTRPIMISDSRSEERRGGQECVRTGRSRWSQSHEKKNSTRQTVRTSSNNNNMYPHIC